MEELMVGCKRRELRWNDERDAGLKDGETDVAALVGTCRLRVREE
jgi:hypothetical protein